MSVLRARTFVVVTALLWLGSSSAASPLDDRPAGLRNVSLDQRLNEHVPLDLTFRDESGRAVRFGDYFGTLPVILTLTYYDCPMLCPLVLNDVLRALRVIPLSLGREFRVLTVSIDPHDTPAQAATKQQWYVDRYGRPGAAEGWHFLTGEEPAIESLTRAAGFRHTFDSQS